MQVCSQIRNEFYISKVSIFVTPNPFVMDCQPQEMTIKLHFDCGWVDFVLPETAVFFYFSKTFMNCRILEKFVAFRMSSKKPANLIVQILLSENLWPLSCDVDAEADNRPVKQAFIFF